jgi:hypothetical protein
MSRTKAQLAVDRLRDFAREHGMDFRERDPLVMAIHDALDAKASDAALVAPREPEGDRAENTTDNPQSWVAWKREAETSAALVAGLRQELAETQRQLSEALACPALLCPFEKRAAELEALVSRLSALVQRWQEYSDMWRKRLKDEDQSPAFVQGIHSTWTIAADELAALLAEARPGVAGPLSALDLNLQDMLETVLNWLMQDVRDNGPGASGGRQLRVDRVRDALKRDAALRGVAVAPTPAPEAEDNRP